MEFLRNNDKQCSKEKDAVERHLRQDLQLAL